MGIGEYLRQSKAQQRFKPLGNGHEPLSILWVSLGDLLLGHYSGVIGLIYG